MPQFCFDGVDMTRVAGGNAVVTRAGVWIRREDEDGNWSPDSALPASGVAVVTPTVTMASLTEVFGILLVGRMRADATNQDIREWVGIQISLDGGATFQAWTGAEWEEVAVDDAYNTQTEFAENCGSLALSWDPTAPMSVCLRLLLLPSDDDDTPVVERVLLFCEWAKFRAFTNLHATLHRIFSTEYSLRVRQQIRLEEASDTFQLVLDYPTLVSTTDLEVYDVTDDPGRTSNLFDSYAGGVVTLTGEVDEAHVLETFVTVRPPVTVVRRDETASLTSIPHLVVEIAEIMEDPASPQGFQVDLKLGSTERAFRERADNVLATARIRVFHHTRRADEALDASDALQVALSSDLRLLGTGFPINVIEQAANAVMDQPAASFQSGVWVGMLRFQLPPTEYVESRLVDSIRIRFGDGRIVFDGSLEVTAE